MGWMAQRAQGRRPSQRFLARWQATQAATTAGKSSKPPKKSVPAEIPSTYFTLSEKDRQILGWQPGGKPFVFFLQPSYPGQPHILLNEWQVERAIG